MKGSQNTCPICGEGHLNAKISQNNVEYKTHSTQLDTHCSVCDSCGSEQANSEQLRVNKRAMVAFKKQVDGLLTGHEVRKLREQLGINQAEAARIFGGGPVAFSKYESDDVSQSEAMDKLLRLAISVPSAYTQLLLNSGIEDRSEIRWVRVKPIDKPTQAQKPTTSRVILKSHPQLDSGWKEAG